jgi:hypothetical protein
MRLSDAYMNVFAMKSEKQHQINLGICRLTGMATERPTRRFYIRLLNIQRVPQFLRPLSQGEVSDTIIKPG